MSMLRYANYEPFLVLRNEMEQLLDEYLPGTALRRAAAPQRVGGPALNVWESAEATFVEAEVPGLTMHDIELSVQGNELTLCGECRAQGEESAAYHRRECRSGKFTRVLRLPCAADADRVEAQLKNGVLTIRLPKAEAAKPRKIAVVQ